jgi:hypothetical protein
VRPELGLGWPESTSLDRDKTCRAASLDAPNGVGRGTLAGRGWTGSKAETRGGPGRAGPRSKMYRWRLVTLECQQTTVPELFSNDSTLLKVETWKNWFPVQATMITSHKTTHSCGTSCRRSNNIEVTGCLNMLTQIYRTGRRQNYSRRSRASSHEQIHYKRKKIVHYKTHTRHNVAREDMRAIIWIIKVLKPTKLMCRLCLKSH